MAIFIYEKIKFFVAVVTQEYETDAHKVYVIVGNSALIKCEIPSFVADFVSVYSWTDNNNNEYFTGINKNYGKIDIDTNENFSMG